MAMIHHDKHDDDKDSLAIAVTRLARSIESLASDVNTKQVLQKLDQMEGKIMSVISEFAAKQKAFNDRQSAAIDAATTSVTGLSGDIQALNDKITELQNSQGSVTPEDQALLDELQTAGDALATKVEGVSSALAALDALTPPTPPPAG